MITRRQTPNEDLINIAALYIVFTCMDNTISSQYYVSAADVADYMSHHLQAWPEVTEDVIDDYAELIVENIDRRYFEMVLTINYVEEEKLFDIQVYDLYR